MANGSKKKSVEDSSWKSIKQTTRLRPLSPIARRRRLMLYTKAAILGIVAALWLGGLVWSVRYFRQTGNPLALASAADPLSQVYFETDGVLTHGWLSEQLALPRTISLMDIDIFSLQSRLLAHGQVSEVQVERLFPDSLRIRIKEHHPVLRLAIQDAVGKRQLMLVSPEGMVYAGKDYPVATLRRLPFLDGVVLNRSGDGFERLRGMETVSQLLREARENHPHLYSQWQIVSCRNFQGDVRATGASIEVTTRNLGKVIFKPGEFEHQLQRLDMIVSYHSEAGLHEVASIDLTMNEPVMSFGSRTQGQRGIQTMRR